MGDTGDAFRAWRDYVKIQRDLHGVACPVCVEKLPKANPSILLPGQRCKIHGYRDNRPRVPQSGRE